MPTIPVYIRKEDYPKFLEKYSPEWLHEKLNEGMVTSITRQDTYPKMATKLADELDNKVIQNAVSHPTDEMACCKNRQPCRHWIWDGVAQTYTNSISGRVVEVV